jgi:hypothetical protein
VTDPFERVTQAFQACGPCGSPKGLRYVSLEALPMMAILGIGVLVITYVPWLTTVIPGMLGRR